MRSHTEERIFFTIVYAINLVFLQNNFPDAHLESNAMQKKMQQNHVICFLDGVLVDEDAWNFSNFYYN